MNALVRFFLRWHWMAEYEKSLNARAQVEQELLDVARGVRPPPDRDQCRRWAVKLGVPRSWRP